MVNKVILIGRIGSDPETKPTAGGTVLKFRLATDERYVTKSGEKVEKTEWHSIVLFGKFADVFARMVGKGKLVYVEGMLRTDSWDDPKTGEKRSRVEIVADQMRMLEKRDSGGSEAVPF